MRYLIKLTPLEPFLFGGDNTFGKLGAKDEDEAEGTYLVSSRQFPQQSAILGMIRKQMMTQAGVLTRKVRGEWVDGYQKQKAKELVGEGKFSMENTTANKYGKLKSIEPVFLINKDTCYIKKVKSFIYKDGLLDGYDPKEDDIYDNFVSPDDDKTLKSSDIFEPIEQIGNKKGGEENSLFKKTSYKLKKEFSFAFYMESDFELKNSVVTLGADRSSFNMSVQKSKKRLKHEDKNGYLTLLSDSLITLPLKEYCDFATTSEISFRNLQNKKHVSQHNEFKKSQTVYLYEKGSVIVNPKQELIDNLNNKNCQNIGYNHFTYKGEEKWK